MFYLALVDFSKIDTFPPQYSSEKISSILFVSQLNLFEAFHNPFDYFYSFKAPQNRDNLDMAINSPYILMSAKSLQSLACLQYSISTFQAAPTQANQIFLSFLVCEKLTFQLSLRKFLLWGWVFYRGVCKVLWLLFIQHSDSPVSEG